MFYPYLYYIYTYIMYITHSNKMRTFEASYKWKNFARKLFWSRKGCICNKLYHNMQERFRARGSTF